MPFQSPLKVNLADIEPDEPTGSPRQRILDRAASYGLGVSSTTRTPARNRAVGGAKNSYHLASPNRSAYDLTGTPEQLGKFAKEASREKGVSEVFFDPAGVGVKKGRNVGVIGGHSDHAHVAFDEPDNDLRVSLDDIEPDEGGAVASPSSTSSLLDELLRRNQTPAQPKPLPNLATVNITADSPARVIEGERVRNVPQIQTNQKKGGSISVPLSDIQDLPPDEFVAEAQKRYINELGLSSAEAEVMKGSLGGDFNLWNRQTGKPYTPEELRTVAQSQGGNLDVYLNPETVERLNQFKSGMLANPTQALARDAAIEQQKEVNAANPQSEGMASLVGGGIQGAGHLLQLAKNIYDYAPVSSGGRGGFALPPADPSSTNPLEERGEQITTDYGAKGLKGALLEGLGTTAVTLPPVLLAGGGAGAVGGTAAEIAAMGAYGGLSEIHRGPGPAAVNAAKMAAIVPQMRMFGQFPRAVQGAALAVPAGIEAYNAAPSDAEASDAAIAAMIQSGALGLMGGKRTDKPTTVFEGGRPVAAATEARTRTYLGEKVSAMTPERKNVVLGQLGYNRQQKRAMSDRVKDGVILEAQRREGSSLLPANLTPTEQQSQLQKLGYNRTEARELAFRNPEEAARILESQERKGSTSTPRQIPTPEQQRELAQLGYDRPSRRALSPGEAQRIIDEGRKKEIVDTNPPPTAPTEIEAVGKAEGQEPSPVDADVQAIMERFKQKRTKKAEPAPITDLAERQKAQAKQEKASVVEEVAPTPVDLIETATPSDRRGTTTDEAYFDYLKRSVKLPREEAEAYIRTLNSNKGLGKMLDAYRDGKISREEMRAAETKYFNEYVAKKGITEAKPSEPAQQRGTKVEPPPATKPERASITKLVEKIERESTGQLNLQGIRRKLKEGGEVYERRQILIEGLKGIDDADVKASKAISSKGAIVVGKDGEIIDGRNRAAAARARGEKTIDAYVPQEIATEPKSSSPKSRWDKMTPEERIEFLAPNYSMDYRLNPRIFDKVAGKSFDELSVEDRGRVSMHFGQEGIKQPPPRHPSAKAKTQSYQTHS